MSRPLLWIIPALPLAAVALNLLLGDRLGRRGTAWLACGMVGAAFIAALRAVLGLAALPADARAMGSLDGQIFVFFVMTVAAAEVAVGLAIIVNVFRLKETVYVDEINLLKG